MAEHRVSPRLTSAIPKLASLDIGRSVTFFARLGFQHLAIYDTMAIVRRDDVEIHFWLTDKPSIPHATGCRVNVDGIDRLYEQYLPLGVVHPNGPLCDQPWGLREFSILDGDGYLLTFASPITV